MLHTHHAFKLDTEVMLKNTNFKKFSPTLEKFEHTHIFHTIDSQGRRQTKCSPVGGHYHYVDFKENPDGSVTVSCGPAKQIVEKRLKSGGFRRTEAEISFYDERTDGNTVDSHKHEVMHLYSEEIQIDPSRQNAAAAIKATLEPKSHPDIKDME
jgi:Lon protease-like protein